MPDTEAPPKHTERQILDLELARLSISDLDAARRYADLFPNLDEWKWVSWEVHMEFSRRMLKLVERVRLVKAEEATDATS